MDDEKKYKKLVDAVKVLRDSNPSDEGIQKWVNDNVPELKESEDEKIRKALIEHCKNQAKPYIYTGNECPQIQSWIAWLEKQSEKFQYWKPSEEQLEALDYAYNSCSDTERGNYYKGVLETIIDDLHKLSENQGKQKPTDKVGPKFNVGVWLVHDMSDGSVTHAMQIVDITDKSYIMDSGDSWYFSDAEESYREWTIQDAKDGDVLEFGDHGRLVVGIVRWVNKTTGKVDVYCLLEGNKVKLGFYYNLDTVKPHPATKEQRDLLFQEMKEAGYEWDAEKKELKKIDIIPLFNIGDTIIKKHNSDIRNFGSFTITDITGGKYWYNGRIICDITEQNEWELYEPVRQKSAWGEEDDDMLADIMRSLKVMEHEIFTEDIHGNTQIASRLKWLESLKDKLKPQPKQEWSEEDETALCDALWCCKKAASIAKNENDMGNIWYAENWLKSLKERVNYP